MTLALFVKNLTSGGAEKQSLLLAQALTDRHEVHYIVFNAAKVHQKYLEQLRSMPQVRFYACRGSHLRRFAQLVRYLHRQQIRLVFSYLTAANLYAALAGRLTGTKVVAGLRNIYLPHGKLEADRFVSNWLAYRTVCNSHAGYTYFCQQGWRAQRLTIIPNGFSGITPYRPKEVQGGVVQIISVGRFVAQKDYATAIESIRLLRKVYADIRYLIVGYGEEEDRVRQWVAEAGLADITQIRINPDQIAALLAESDIYLSTSQFEGTCNSILEAMNADLPVVCTQVGDNDRMVEDGVNGYLTDVGAPAAVAERLDRLCRQPQLRLEMGKTGKCILQERYSMEACRARYEELISGC